ncbi:MAG: AAA family ATPase [Ruminococcaceae bacterium]|nr:AAA family ATPase [Oscillospiraceae bacterium]
MTNDKSVARFDSAVMLLPTVLREKVRRLSKEERCLAEEFRLRKGRPMTVLVSGKEIEVNSEPIRREHIDSLLDIATRVSVHTVRDSLKNGYITAKGGYRIGICGTAILKNGEVEGFREITSVSVRIAREIIGLADRVSLPVPFTSTLIISPPGCGKTTLLRDIVRKLSDSGVRVSLADERSEIAAVWQGETQMDVGKSTDVIDGCPKSQAIIMLLRAMTPQVIALDEITHPDDISAIREAANCGVELLASAHAWDENDLAIRPMYSELMKQRIFKNLIIISKKDGIRNYEVKKLC